MANRALEAGAGGLPQALILTENRRVYIIAPLMRTPLSPELLDPWRLAAEGGRWEGALALAALLRLVAATHRVEGVVAAVLTAGVDLEGVRWIQVTLRADGVELLCQRCLEPLPWPLRTDVRLGLARSEAEADCLPAAYEPLLAVGPLLKVSDLIEDELLLALPRISRHPDPADCAAHGYQPPQGRDDSPAPWAALLQDWKRSH